MDDEYDVLTRQGLGLVHLLVKNTKVMTRESNWHKRKVKEAIYISNREPLS